MVGELQKTQSDWLDILLSEGRKSVRLLLQITSVWATLRIRSRRRKIFRCFDWSKDPGEVIGVSHSYDQIHFCSNRLYWSRDENFKYSMHIDDRRTLLGWYYLELLAVSLLVQPRLYPPCSSWWERVEHFDVLAVPTSPVLAHYTSLVVSYLLPLQWYGTELPLSS